MKGSCDILNKNGMFIIYPYCRMQSGIKVSYKPFEIIHEKDISFIEFNKMVERALHISAEVIIRDGTNMKDIIDFEVNKIGFKSRMELDKKAKGCIVYCDGNKIELIPTKNIGKGRGYDHLYEKKVVFLYNRNEETFLKNVIEVFAISQ